MLPAALLLSDDLMDASRVTAQARAEGLAIRQVRSFQDLLTRLAAEPPSCLLLDLHHAELDLAELMRRIDDGKLAVRVIGYGSHVDAERLKAARRAGLSSVMPRSQFFDAVRTDLKNWLGL